jgi:hypothetical protein
MGWRIDETARLIALPGLAFYSLTNGIATNDSRRGYNRCNTLAYLLNPL